MEGGLLRAIDSCDMGGTCDINCDARLVNGGNCNINKDTLRFGFDTSGDVQTKAKRFDAMATTGDNLYDDN